MLRAVLRATGSSGADGLSNPVPHSRNNKRAIITTTGSRCGLENLHDADCAAVHHQMINQSIPTKISSSHSPVDLSVGHGSSSSSSGGAQ